MAPLKLQTDIFENHTNIICTIMLKVTNVKLQYLSVHIIVF